MYYVAMLVISGIILLITIIGVVYTVVKEHAFSRVAIIRLIVGVGASLFPLYLLGNAGATGGVFDWIVSSLLGVVRTVTGENSLGDTREIIGTVPAELERVVANYTAVLHLLSATLILSFIFSLFQNAFSRFSYRFLERGGLCVFTEVSRRTLVLANDIRKRENEGTLSRNCLVFLGKADEEDLAFQGYREQLNVLGAHLFDLKLSQLNVPHHFWRKSVCFFLMKTNEEENLKDALELAACDEIKSMLATCEAKNMPVKCKVFILNSNPEAVAVVDAIEHRSELNLRLLNENKLMVYDLFDKQPLFLCKREENRLKILIVGAGRNGLAATQVGAWCGQTVHLKPEIIVVDKDSAWEQRFEQECPEIAPKTRTQESLEECRVTFYAQDVEEQGFIDILKKHPDVGYVICALGDEELNLRTALKIRKAYEEIRYVVAVDKPVMQAPQIHVLLHNEFLFDVCDKLLMNAKAPADLQPFGCLKSLYTWDNIVSPYFDHLGMACNRFYHRYYARDSWMNLEKAEQEKMCDSIDKAADIAYEQSEFHRNSSMALGMHGKYKLYAILVEIAGENISAYDWGQKPTEEMIAQVADLLQDETVVEQISYLEHTRWNMYERAQGWKGAKIEAASQWYGIDRNDHRNHRAKLNVCIGTWNALDTIDTWLKENHNININFKELDRVMVRDLAVIMRQAKKESSR